MRPGEPWYCAALAGQWAAAGAVERDHILRQHAALLQEQHIYSRRHRPLRLPRPPRLRTEHVSPPPPPPPTVTARPETTSVAHPAAAPVEADQPQPQPSRQQLGLSASEEGGAQAACVNAEERLVPAVAHAEQRGAPRPEQQGSAGPAVEAAPRAWQKRAAEVEVSPLRAAPEAAQALTSPQQHQARLPSAVVSSLRFSSHIVPPLTRLLDDLKAITYWRLYLGQCQVRVTS